METKITVVCDETDDEGRITAKNVIEIVKAVQDSNCKCLITRFKTVSADSILMLMALGIKNGDTVTIKCDDENCVKKIRNILQEEAESD